jgi:hypothetical protein
MRIHTTTISQHEIKYNLFLQCIKGKITGANLRWQPSKINIWMIMSFYLSHTLYIIANLDGNQAKSIFQCSYLIHYTLLFFFLVWDITTLVFLAWSSKPHFTCHFPGIHDMHVLCHWLVHCIIGRKSLIYTGMYMKFQINAFA